MCQLRLIVVRHRVASNLPSPLPSLEINSFSWTISRASQSWSSAISHLGSRFDLKIQDGELRFTLHCSYIFQ